MMEKYLFTLLLCHLSEKQTYLHNKNYVNTLSYSLKISYFFLLGIHSATENVA